MPTPRLPWTKTLRRARLLEEAVAILLLGMVKILAALPSRWVLALGDGLGLLLARFDRRGRAAAFQNMRVAFGERMTAHERERLLRASMRHVARCVLLLLHLHPLTPRRFRAWVDTGDVHATRAGDAQRVRDRGAVFVSGHIGNWELLLGLRLLFPDFPPTVFLAEAIESRSLDRLLARLRSHGDLVSAMRKGGARTVLRTVGAGGTAGLLVDRNVRRRLGGVYAPFLGIEACTSPLPALLALRYQVPVFPVFVLPHGDRFRLELGPDLTRDLPPGTVRERTRTLLTRINASLEAVIRERPALWNWTLKRFKSRPHEDAGPYPAYAEYDPP